MTGPDFKKGLVEAILQDQKSGKVLMSAYMDKKAFELTLSTGLAHFYSRSRKRIWKKGEESGNIQRVREIRIDCDGDALLLKVDGKPACHTGHETCFYRRLDGKATGKRKTEPAANLREVYETILARKQKKPSGSYVASIIRDRKKLAEKIREESEEAIEAFEKKNRQEVAWECADLIFHTLLLMANRGIKWEELMEEFARRNREHSRRSLGESAPEKNRGAGPDTAGSLSHMAAPLQPPGSHPELSG